MSQDASDDMSYRQDTKLAKEQDRKNDTEQERGFEGKELMNG